MEGGGRLEGGQTPDSNSLAGILGLLGRRVFLTSRSRAGRRERIIIYRWGISFIDYWAHTWDAESIEREPECQDVRKKVAEQRHSASAESPSVKGCSRQGEGRT